MNKLFIEARELKDSLTEHCILDCRFSLVDTGLGQQQYQQGHIPGAFYANLDNDLSGTKGETGGRHPLPDLTQFAETLMRFGVTKSSSVVVYDDNKLAYASRAWWLMKAVGIENVRILNGGYKAWQSAGGEFELTIPPLNSDNTASEVLTWQEPVFNYCDVRTAINTKAITLVDSREESRYRGEQEPIDPIAGHIPTAINKMWGEVSDDQGFIQDTEFHHQRWAEIPDDKPLVIYCGSGVTACVNILSAALAGREAILYVGSWSDWCNRQGAEIATISD